MLTFSLDDGAPTNAVINAASGLFNWTPTAAQAPATNLITVRVTDNGTPSLSAARTFTVTVLVGFRAMDVLRLPNGDLSFTLATTPGKSYRVEYKNALNAPTWQPLGPDVVAASTSLTMTDPIIPNSQRFYRVVQVD